MPRTPPGLFCVSKLACLSTSRYSSFLPTRAYLLSYRIDVPSSPSPLPIALSPHITPLFPKHACTHIPHSAPQLLTPAPHPPLLTLISSYMSTCVSPSPSRSQDWARVKGPDTACRMAAWAAWGRGRGGEGGDEGENGGRVKGRAREGEGSEGKGDA